MEASPQTTIKPLPPAPMMGRGLPNNPAEGVRRKLPLQQLIPASPATFSLPAPGPRPESAASAAAAGGSGNGNEGGAVPAAAASAGKAPSPPRTSGAPPPVSGERVLALAREALKHAVSMEQGRAEDSGTQNVERLGRNVNMSRENIRSLPDEIVDIFTRGLERLALSHNFVTELPPRFAEFTSLRYLNVKNNALEKFPLVLCNLKALEFLDLGWNWLKALPPDIAQLSALKVFSIERNKIEELPACLADMLSLQRLKFEDNPIVSPPKEVLQFQPPEGLSSEDAERFVTANIRKFLRRAHRHLSERSDPKLEALSEMKPLEFTPAELNKGVEASRYRFRRATGRFPVKPGIDALSHSQPSVPTRPEYRVPSLSDAGAKRPSASLLSDNAGKPRSTSAPEVPQTQHDEIPPQVPTLPLPELTEDVPPSKESSLTKRFSQHNRGLSYGSVMENKRQSRSLIGGEDLFTQRPQFVRKLAALPVRRNDSAIPDLVLEVAKGVMYSVYHIHVGIQTLMGLTNDGTVRRSSLEMVFYNTNVYFQELESAIQTYCASPDPPALRDNESMQRAYATLLTAYIQICSPLMSSIDQLVENGDLRYVRTFAMMIYHSIMELRVATFGNYLPPSKPDELGGDTLRPAYRPLPSPPTTMMKSRPPVLNMKARSFPRRNLQIKTDIAYSSRQQQATAIAINRLMDETPTTATIVPPRSGASFTSAISSPASEVDREDFLSADDSLVRFLESLQAAASALHGILPGLNDEFATGHQRAIERRAPVELGRAWERLAGLCEDLVRQAHAVQQALTPNGDDNAGGQDTRPLRDLCNAFFGAWATLGDEVKASVVVGARFSAGAREQLQRVSRVMRDSIVLMSGVPNRALARPVPTGRWAEVLKRRRGL